MKQKVIRAGRHSLAVIIPAAFTHAVGVKAGDRVEVRQYPENGRVSLHFKGNLQLPLSLNSRRIYKIKSVK